MVRERNLKKRKGAAGAIVVLLLFLILGYVAVSIDIIDCPKCGNTPLLRSFDSYCGYDGKVPLLQYIMYIIS